MTGPAPPTLGAADASVYTNLSGLSSLRRGASSQDPTAIRKIAQQFESLFTRMMLKSMRDAVGPDPMFGSDQEQMYQSMADDQLSVQLSRGKGLGLADMLIHQLQKLGVPGAAAAAADRQTPSAKSPNGAAAYVATQRAGSAASSPASPEIQSNFVRTMWDNAQQAGQQLGVDPRNLIAQAALETNWGRSLPQDATGRSSNNLFGVKASTGWDGPSVAATTQEYQGSAALSATARFRAYPNQQQSFQDYAALLRENPRYASALNTGDNVQAFASGLQRGGYATDPDYVQKLHTVAQNVATVVTDLKSRDSLPLTAETGALQGP